MEKFGNTLSETMEQYDETFKKLAKGGLEPVVLVGDVEDLLENEKHGLNEFGKEMLERFKASEPKRE